MLILQRRSSNTNTGSNSPHQELSDALLQCSVSAQSEPKDVYNRWRGTLFGNSEISANKGLLSSALNILRGLYHSVSDVGWRHTIVTDFSFFANRMREYDRECAPEELRLGAAPETPVSLEELRDQMWAFIESNR